MTPEQADVIKQGVAAGDSFRTIGKRLGLPDSSVRKWCKEQGIKKWRKPRSQTAGRNHPFRIGLYGLAMDRKGKI